MTDILEIEKLTDLTQLIELQIQSNPLVRKNLYRAQIIKKLPQLLYLDAKVGLSLLLGNYDGRKR